ncbi:hypothetical protein PI95_003705 [Hassallia byssoidea VB512170]|uniref:Uncharacterized protein n=1 Tax=Hassallia byssoidea VB512170 TaxID=1304833 RepID=A0A846H2Q4_9CYAN|nr:hypothetical protein [Hassalia byssoidea]NEU71712.1 hypothetical protein [Hassalia byssoidea VB512170]
MSDILTLPQAQILTHQVTSKQTGRVYFPAMFVAENQDFIKSWLSQDDISFDERDIKYYSDGSFRIYFKSPKIKKKIEKLYQ